MNFIYTLLCLLGVTFSMSAQNSLSEPYLNGDIATFGGSYDESCSGPAQIVFHLPAGDQYEVTGLTVAYYFQSVSPSSPNNQQSRLKCINTGNAESTIYGSINSNPGDFQFYQRYNVDIANGIYSGGDSIVLELEAWRIPAGPCNVLSQYVTDGSWKIDLFFSNEIPFERVGVKTTQPSQALDVNGKIQIGTDSYPPTDGTIMYQNNTFYGYANGSWQNLSQNKEILGVSDIPTNGRFNYGGLKGIQAGHKMCRDAFPNEPTARMYFSDDIDNAVSLGNFTGIVSEESYWTLVNTFESINDNYSVDDNCYNFNDLDGSISRGTVVQISLDEQIPGNLGTLATYVNYINSVSCGNSYKIVCGK